MIINTIRAADKKATVFVVINHRSRFVLDFFQDSPSLTRSLFFAATARKLCVVCVRTEGWTYSRGIGQGGNRIAGTSQETPKSCSSWSDVRGSTGNELSRRGFEVVNPHSGPMITKIAKLVRGEREPTQASS